MEEEPTKVTRWPGWVGNGIFLVSLAAVFLLPGGFMEFLTGSIAIFGVFAAIAVGLTISTFVSLRRSSPEQVFAENDALKRGVSPCGRRGFNWLLVGGFLACIALVAVIAMLVAPDDRAAQFGLVLKGTGLIVIGLCLPLTVWVVGWLVGAFIKPISAKGEFVLSMDGDPREALALRADPYCFVRIAEGLNRAEPLNDGSGRYRLYPEGFFARLFGMGQVAHFSLAGDRSWFETDSLTVSGDRERLVYRIVPGAQGTEALAGTLESDLHSPLMKVLAVILGPDHLLKGGAMVEARRLSDMLESRVEVEMRHASF